MTKPPEAVTLTIDGKSVTVGKGTTVIQAAEELGIFIPRYCYHPGLSIAGNCRICLCEVEKAPKLQIACNTPAEEGMVVNTQTPRVQEGQSSVLEFLLANHPLDCPVCDQSGECDLQNYYMSYGRYDARFEEQKVKKSKAVPLGPTVMLDTERCILCSRCERFTDEVSKTGEFGIFNRGDQATIGLYPGKVLDNKYAGNVVDICPVGALTDRDFRFKSRVWYLSTTPSVCNGCSQGCNIDLNYVVDRPHLNDGARVMRVKPRYNADVNQWWMCDEGRYGYKFIDQNRLTQVLARGTQTTWEAALTELTSTFEKIRAQERQERIGILPSAQLTTEELFLIWRLAKALEIEKVSAQVPEKPGSSDDFLIQADKNPNSAGAQQVGFLGEGVASASELIDQAIAGDIRILWVFGHDLVALFGEEKVKTLAEKLDLFIFQGSNANGTSQYAHWVLPSATYAEKDGVFVNCQGRAQRIFKAFDPIKVSRPDWEILLEVGSRLNVPFTMKSPEDVFAAIGELFKPFQGLTYEQLGSAGVLLAQADSPKEDAAHVG